jgi:hypothetical protein
MDSVELSFNHGFWGYFLTLIYLAGRSRDPVSRHNMGILTGIRNHDLNLKCWKSRRLATEMVRSVGQLSIHLNG